MERKKIPRILLIVVFMIASINGLAQHTITFRDRPNVSAGPDQILVPGQTQVQAQATVDDATASILWNGPVDF